MELIPEPPKQAEVKQPCVSDTADTKKPLSGRRRQRATALTNTIVFCVLLFGLTFLDMLTPTKTFSETENRLLAQKPEFSGEALFAGTYTADYESYVTDQYVARDRWIRLKTDVERLLQKKESNGVYFAKNGYLMEHFYTTDVDEELLAKNEERLLTFVARYVEQLGSESVKFLLVPSASELLTEKLPKYATGFPQKEVLIRLLQAAEANTGIDGYEALKNHSEDYIYYKTDHHWTTLGAYYAYEAWANACGLTPIPQSAYSVTRVSDNFYGTLYAKVNASGIDPDEIFCYLDETKCSVVYNMGERTTNTLYEYEALHTKDQYTFFLDGNHALVEITNESGGRAGRHLLVLKDSFAHCMIPFLVPHFEKISVVDFRYFNLPISEWIEAQEVTDILVLYNVMKFAADKNLYQLLR